jgi:hypothetical protein
MRSRFKHSEWAQGNQLESVFALCQRILMRRNCGLGFQFVLRALI